MKYSIFVLFFIFTIIAQAQIDRKGNGGDVVVCKDKAVMLDTYEALNLRNYGLGLGAANDSIDTKIKVAIRRIGNVDPFRALVISWLSENFMNETKFVRGVELRDIKDSNEIFLPEGCKSQQIAIQNTKVIFSDPFYVVNADLWDRLDNDNKAILILHESIYRASSDQWDSSTVRFLNSMAFSTFLDGKRQRDYYELVHGTVLKDTVNAATHGTNLWYFQIPKVSPSLDKFMMAEIWNKEVATKSWQYMCNFKQAGDPIKESELQIISDIIHNDYDWGNLTSAFPKRTVFTKDGDQLKAFDISYQGGITENLENDVQGEVWCSSDYSPFRTIGL
jgi:hypothetical protein